MPKYILSLPRGFFLILFSLQWIWGCTTAYTKKECEDLNWQEEGFKIGTWGDPNIEDRVALFRQKCGKAYGFQLNEKLFRTGYFNGIKILLSKRLKGNKKGQQSHKSILTLESKLMTPSQDSEKTKN